MNDSGSHLTTSRVSRCFRPLRAKCIALAAPITTPTKHHAPITYGSSTRGNSEHATNITPRAFSFVPLPAPEKLPFHFGTWSRETLRDLSALSRKIGEVRDSFRSLVKVANGGWPTFVMAHTTPSIPRLGTLCAGIVGEHLEDHVEESMEEGKSALLEGDTEMEAFEEIYEAVPSHYRRYTMVSHALKYILHKCPHYPTLLSALLDVTVAFRLLCETKQLLHLLCVAYHHVDDDPSVDSRSRQEHFFSLYEKCSGPQVRGSPLINNVIFFRIMTSHGILRSDPVPKIIRGIRSRDYDTFITLCLIQTRKIIDCAETRTSSQTTLSEWLYAILQQSLSNESAATPRLEEFVANVDLLAEMHIMGVEKSSISDALSKNILSLTLHCFASNLLPKCRLESRQALFSTLKELAPKTETYDGFASMLLPESTIMYALEFVALPDVLNWANVLRDHALYHHEASFCSAILRQIERLLTRRPASHSSATNRLLRSLEALRPELVDMIEDAERLCFGPPDNDQDDATEWRWEEMVGCWVRKSPIVVRKVSKRSKGQDGVSSQLNAHNDERAVRHAGSSSSSTTSTRSSSESSMSPEPLDVYTPPSSPSPSVESQFTRSPSPQTRRISNFNSIVADAQSNCTVLHTPNSRQSRSYTIDEDLPYLPLGSDDLLDEAHLSSDDFNLTYSSPTVVRHKRMH